MSRITHFLAEIIDPKNSASGNFLTFSMSGTAQPRLVFFFINKMKLFLKLNNKRLSLFFKIAENRLISQEFYLSLTV